MSSDKYDSDVELPEYNEEDADKLPVPIRGMSSRVMAVTLLIAVAAFIVIAFLLQTGTERKIASIPKLEKAWILSRLEGEDVADDTPKTVLDGRGVMLYLVAYGYDKVADDYYYYTDSPYDQLPRLIIEGQEIPANKIRLFDFFDTTSIVYWYKLELSRGFLENTSVSQDKRINWTLSRRHRMGTRWWAIADVRADSYQYHYNYVGTMYYMAELEVVRGKDHENVIASLKVGDVDKEKDTDFPEGAHRVTIANINELELTSAYNAYFNLASFEDRDWNPSAAEMTREFRGGNSTTFLAGAMALLGFDINIEASDFLPQYCDQIYNNVTIDEFLYFRPEGNESGVIPYGEDGVQKGDIIKRGDRYMIIVGNTPTDDEPEPGVLTGDDEVIDAWNAPVQRTYAHLLQDTEGPISIWRLRRTAPAADE